MKNLNKFGTTLMAIGLSLSLNVMAEDAMEAPINCATAAYAL